MLAVPQQLYPLFFSGLYGNSNTHINRGHNSASGGSYIPYPKLK